jgi:hypothetical protein
MYSEISPMAMASALGGEYRQGKIHAPGPGHSKRDRSLTIWLDPKAPSGYRLHSFADDWKTCRNYVDSVCGFESFTPGRQRASRPVWRPEVASAAAIERERQASRTKRMHKAQSLWSSRCRIAGSPGETYLRQARGYQGPIPATLGFLPARGEYAPAIIAAFGLPQEPEPGMLSMPVDSIAAVHLIRLRSDGLGKITEKPKITIGSPGGMPIVVAPLNDGLALAITEGIEDALSVSAAGFGAWAAGSAVFMPSLADTVPAYSGAVTVISDGDGTGIRNADELARRLTVRRIHVERIHPDGGVL